MCPNLLGKFWNREAIPDTRESVVEIKAAQAVQLMSTLTAKPNHKVYFQQASSAGGVYTQKGHLAGCLMGDSKDW